MGLYEDTNIDSNQFSTLAWVFYVSYLFFEFPHGYGMQRLPTAKYLGVMVTLWGVMVTVTSACNNYGSLVALRVMLGCFESAVAPALILITTMWYKRSEQVPRTGLWYCGTGTGTIIGSLVSFGFQHYRGHDFTSWQIMFLVLGLLTIAVGITVILVLPDNPMSARWLTRAEKVAAVERVRENQTGIENKRWKWHQASECFQDPQTWLLAVMVVSSSIPNGAVSSFQATIIKNFGYSSEATALLQIASGGVAIVAILSATFIAGYTNSRGINIITLLLPGGILGGGLLAFLPSDNKAGKLIGNYLTQLIGASLPLQYSWVAANFAGHTKKVCMNAILLMSFCLGNILGPLSFRKQDAPNYVPAKITILAVCCVSVGFTVCLMLYYKWENRRRDREAESRASVGGFREGHHVKDLEFLDLTDRENREFRYRL